MTYGRPLHASPAVLFMLLGILLALGGCRSAPSPEQGIAPTTDTRGAVTALALEQLGAPYQAGAAGPDRFDDSGLGYFAYRGAGAGLPRATQAQLDAGKPVDLAAAQPADLLFFRIENPDGGDRLTVGLFTQAGEMLMAVPNVQDEDSVALLDLDDPFWQDRLVAVIRVLQ